MGWKGSARGQRGKLQSLPIPMLSDLLQENHGMQYLGKLLIPPPPHSILPKPAHHGANQLKFVQSLQSVPEERSGAQTQLGFEILNSY